MAALTALAKRANLGALSAAPSMPTPASTFCLLGVLVLDIGLEGSDAVFERLLHVGLHCLPSEVGLVKLGR